MIKGVWALLLVCSFCFSHLHAIGGREKKQQGQPGAARTPSLSQQVPKVSQHPPKTPLQQSKITPTPSPGKGAKVISPSRSPIKPQIQQQKSKQYKPNLQRNLSNRPITPQQQYNPNLQRKFAKRPITPQQQYVARNMQREFRRNPARRNWFNRDFFASHHYHPRYYNNRINWWRGAPWAGVASWLDWGWGQPIYYAEDGYPSEVPQEIFYGPPQAIFQPEIYQTAPQAYDYLNVGLNGEDTIGDWMPLGTFAVGKDAMQASYSNMFVQLAINKQGDLEGTYYNASTDQVHALEGTVDRLTQEVLWKMKDKNNSPLMMTGLYNLTQDVVNVKVQFVTGVLENWVLVKLEE